MGWNKPSGKPSNRLLYNMGALQAIEEGLLTEDDLAGLTTTEIGTALVEARKASAAREVLVKLATAAAKVAEARGDSVEADEQKAVARKMRASGKQAEAKVAKKMTAALKSGDVTKKTAAQKAREADPDAPPAGEVDITILFRRITKTVRQSLAGDIFRDQFAELVAHRERMSEDEVDTLRSKLEHLGDRAYDMARSLKAKSPDTGEIIEGEVVDRGSVVEGKAA